ncbi:dTDP-4-dehydrorhamnose reductase [Priestia megaterium]|uniref:dTDP-4-dehydrorhamnose reductase n=1 Tax=Priestia megaterium TaxID=1404 RepID=UPI00345A757B
MKVMVTGSEGQLGKELIRLFSSKGHLIHSYSKAQLDITNQICVEKELSAVQPEVLINTAACTQVDECETNRQQAYLVNSLGPYFLADALKGSKTQLLHLSTDYVFSGTQNVPYKEADLALPNTIYGKSKKIGEDLVLATHAHAKVIRTSWLYGKEGKNFVYTMQRLAKTSDKIRVVHDQHGSPTCTKDLALALYFLLSHPNGIYHMSNSGNCTWFEFAKEILATCQAPNQLIPVTTKKYGLKTPRPAYSVLDTAKIQQLGFSPRHWKDALHDFLREGG